MSQQCSTQSNCTNCRAITGCNWCAPSKCVLGRCPMTGNGRISSAEECNLPQIDDIIWLILEIALGVFLLLLACLASYLVWRICFNGKLPWVKTETLSFHDRAMTPMERAQPLISSTLPPDNPKPHVADTTSYIAPICPPMTDSEPGPQNERTVNDCLAKVESATLPEETQRFVHDAEAANTTTTTTTTNENNQ